MRKVGSDKIRKAYGFLRESEVTGSSFAVEDLSRASGWSLSTAKAYLTKKLAGFVQPSGTSFTCAGLSRVSEEAFCRMFSQKTALARNPDQPLLDPQVEGLVHKARDAAFAAVQHYNNPTSVFRSGNYIVLMTIAYTALFHAIFTRDGQDLIARDKNELPKLIRDEPMLLSALDCAKKYDPNPKSPMVKNLEFMAPIRDKIEHRFMPMLDAEIAGHCQSMLMNFEEILVKEFTPYYSLNTSLSLALQFSCVRSPQTVAALKRFQSAEYEEIKAYVDCFHAQLPGEVAGDPKFEFRVFLVPKPARSARQGDIAIEFVSLADVPPELREDLQRRIVAIKPEKVIVETHAFFNMTIGDLAEAFGYSMWRTKAMIEELKLHDDRDCYRVMEFKKKPYAMYSAVALDRLKEAVENGMDVDRVWRRRRREIWPRSRGATKSKTGASRSPRRR